MFTESQCRHFEQQGVLVVPDTVDASTCKALRERAALLVDAWEPGETRSIFTTREQTRHSDRYFLESGDKIRFFFEEHAFDTDGRLTREKALAINKIGHALHQLDPVFRQFSAQVGLQSLAHQLGQHTPSPIQSMYIFKQPGIGGEVELHQDSTFLYTEPLSVIGFWFALEDATRENGCLWVVPGAHRGPLRKRFIRTPDDRTEVHLFDPTPLPEDGHEAVEVPMGTMVVLHGKLPHCSEINRSSRSRHAYTIHSIDANCHYPADNWLRLGN